MNYYSDKYMVDIFAKTRSFFGDLAVDKRIASYHEFARLPRYVVEYLIAEFTNLCEGKFDEQCADKLNQFVSKFYYEAREKDAVLHNLMKEGTLRLIDEIKVDTDIKSGSHNAQLPSLNIRDAMINRNLVDSYKNLLITGMWGLSTLIYMPDGIPTDSAGHPLRTPVLIEKFEPFQAAESNVDIFKEARENFNLEEWIDVLINTIGLNHKRYDFRQKLVMLSRLVPLIETNVNLMEFGPRATGKTFLYRNISYYTRIFSGGNISAAVLFYNISRRVLGEIGVRDVVIFDEISKVKFSNPFEMIGKLKDYLESGYFERGPKKGFSNSSLVLMGNIQVEKRNSAYIPIEDFTYVLPENMRDSAFIDRIHGIIPGWELPKISKSGIHLSKGIGIASDFFCEILHNLRKEAYGYKISESLELGDEFTIRDEKAVKKILSGLIKLLIPHGSMNKEELKIISDIAIEYRQRVNDWLHILAPGEYPKKRLSYRLKSFTPS